MKFHDASGAAKVAHQVFDTWSGAGTQPMSEGTHAHHLLDLIPDLRGRVLHVAIHQVQRSVPAEVIIEVFSAYGQVEEMFQSLHMQQHTHAPSVFIEYEHGSIADKALHALDGLYLYPNDCQLHIRHANLKELQAFYGYSAPSFSQEQLELLQQIKKDLQALSQNGTFGLVDVCLGTDLEATPPTQKTLSADISSTFEIESSYIEENQEGLDIKEHETQLHWELESLVLPTIALPDACAENEEANMDNLDPVLLQWPTEHQQPQDSSSATIADLTVDFPRLHEQYVQADAEVEHLIKIDVLHRSQPWPLPMEEVINQNSSDAPMLTPTIVITVKEVAEESSDSQTAHINCRIIHPATPPNICRSSPFIQPGHLWNFYFGLVDSNLQPYALVKCVRQPWDPGKMDVLESVDYQWNYSGINTRMSQHKLFAQNELLHRVRLCLFEDQVVIHILQGTKNKWNHSFDAILTQTNQSSDKCQEPEIHENQIVQSFKLNEVRLTSGVQGICHLLLWNLGLQKMQLQLHTIVGATRQMMFKTLLPGWQYFKTAALQVRGEVPTRCLALNSCCFVLSWNTTLEASNFKINEAQLLAPTSALHKLLSHVGDNTQLQSVTWKIREMDIYLWVPTSTTPIVHLLLPWDPGVQQQKLSAPKQVMVRKKFAAFMADQFDTHDIHQLNLKCGKSWFMANTHKPSRFPATIFQKLQTNSVGYMLIYDCSNINSMILTVRSYFYTNSEMNLLLDISSLKECHTVGLVVWKIKFNWPPEFIAINYSLFGSILVPSFANHALSPKKFQLSCPSGKLPPHSDTLLFACTNKIDFYKDSEATLQVRVRSSINIEHCQLKKSCADDSCTLSYILCDATATKDTIIGGLLSSAEHYCKFHSAQIMFTLHNSKTGIIAMIRSHGYSPKCEARLQWDPGANSAYFYSWLEIFRAVEKPMQITQVHTQHQLHSRSIISLWEFSLEKDVQMQCNSGKNCKFNDLTLELYNSWFTILHYCKSFQICKESQVVGRRIMMHLSFLFHIGNITPTHYYEVHLVFKADQCHQAKGTQGTWDSGISFYRTLQPDSDTHYMAFTWT